MLSGENEENNLTCFKMAVRHSCMVLLLEKASQAGPIVFLNKTPFIYTPVG